MRDLKEARTSSNVAGGAPKPFVVWAARLIFLPAPPFVARRNEALRDVASDDDATDDHGLATDNPEATSTAMIMHVHARSLWFPCIMFSGGPVGYVDIFSV
jgi:hypothetical protein